MNHKEAFIALVQGKKIKKGLGYVKLGSDGNLIDEKGEKACYSFGRFDSGEPELYIEQLLTKDERKLLSLLMADFGKKDFVRKIERIQNGGTYEQLQLITHAQGVELTSCLPAFVKGTKFENLELRRGYTKEDLRL